MLEQHLVTQHHIAVVERMLRQKVRRQQARIRLISYREIVGNNVRIVGPVHRHVAEEWPALVRLQN